MFKFLKQKSLYTENGKNIIISLGGSIIAPAEISEKYLKDFSSLINSYIEHGYRFMIITGGGNVARIYINKAKDAGIKNNDDLDYIGIAATRLNAELLRSTFTNNAYEKIVMDPDVLPNTQKPVLVGGGFKPGNSSDLAAVHAAKNLHANTVINLSNIEYVYDKDPRKFTDAVPIHNISWVEFRKLLPVEWDPGLNAPFDPIAAKKAEELGIEVAIMNGNNLENLKNYLDGKEFVGTRIS